MSLNKRVDRLEQRAAVGAADAMEAIWAKVDQKKRRWAREGKAWLDHYQATGSWPTAVDPEYALLLESYQAAFDELQAREADKEKRGTHEPGRAACQT